MSLRDALESSKALAREFDREVNGLEFPASDRARLAAALLDQAHEHHKAVHALLDEGLRGSAFSLLRIMFETTIRGCWLFRCANEQQIEQFKADRFDPYFRDAVRSLEQAYGAPGSLLSRVAKDRWAAMCSFAHGGFLQAVRRITPEHIAPCYSDDEAQEVLVFADFCFFLSGIEVLNICNEPELAAAWQRKYQDTLPQE